MREHYINMGYGSSKNYQECLGKEEIEKILDEINFEEEKEKLIEEYGFFTDSQTYGIKVSRVLDIRDGKIYNVMDMPGTFRCGSYSEITLCSYQLDNEGGFPEDWILGDEYYVDISLEKFQELENWFWVDKEDFLENDNEISFSDFKGNAEEWCLKVLSETQDDYDERISNCEDYRREDIEAEIDFNDKNYTIGQIFYWEDGEKVYPWENKENY